MLGVLYSSSAHFGKRQPVAATLNHLLGGTLHFLLGYATARAVDAPAFALGLIFALVFAAGHLNQEMRDYDVDRANGIRTGAVVFGSRRTFWVSWVMFTAAYLLIAGLAWHSILPRPLVLAGVCCERHEIQRGRPRRLGSTAGPGALSGKAFARLRRRTESLDFPAVSALT